jgi:hypothetical protein
MTSGILETSIRTGALMLVIPACLTTSEAARNYLIALWFFGTGSAHLAVKS